MYQQQIAFPLLSIFVILLLSSLSAGGDDFPYRANYDVSADASCFSKDWDFIIVGGGTAGSVLANRLSATSTVRVLVLEAGGTSQRATGSTEGGTFKYKKNSNGGYELDGSWTRYDVPLLATTMYNNGLDPTSPTYRDWVINGYPAFQAKILGGNGAHNGMLWGRAPPQSFANWNVTNWSFNEMLPFFKKSENVSSSRVSQPNAFHGFAGPIQVTDPAIIDPDAPIFCNATVNTNPNFKYINDFNGNNTIPVQGCGYVYNNIRRGVRDSAVVAYIFNNKAITRPNLSVRIFAQVTKVIFNTAKVATGVNVTDLNTGISYILNANKSVILCGGVFNSPKILLQSGIGPAATLTSLGISKVYDNPNVGKGIRNNPNIAAVWSVANKTNPNYFNHGSQANEYALYGTGMLADTGYNLFALLKTNQSFILPDIFVYGLPDTTPNLYGSFYTLPMLVTNPVFADGNMTLLNNNALSNNIYYYQDYTTPGHAEDINTLVRGIELIRKIMTKAPANTHFLNETSPGLSVTGTKLRDWVKANVGEVFHYSSSAKMGNPGDPLAVVDNRCRVIGVTGLRIVDGSIFPNSTHGLMHANVVAVAERAAVLILSDFGL